ncbi:MAG: TlpA disulfide reductase family protein [Actinomycetota bacterium]
MPRPRAIVLTGTIWGVLMLLAACTGDGEPTLPGAPSAGAPARNATTAPLLPTTVDALPELDPAGYQQLLEQLEGTPVVVNFWGSWCGPCKDEAPDLRAAGERYGDRVQFLGVDILDERTSAAAFIERAGWTYPSVSNPNGDVRDSLGFLGQPITLFYDSSGELVHQRQGAIGPDELRDGIELILASAP